ncbi:MAG: hypothetical protein WCS37_00910 [Chloroflexota bacterium]|nr:hypothetical protein [Chloroflexota bacterium]
MSKLLNKKSGLALLSFVITGVLTILLLASLGGTWGIAYGQTAGPPPTIATATVPTTVLTFGGNPVVPGMPRTGNGLVLAEAKEIAAWQLILLGSLALSMLGSLVALVRTTRSACR